MAIANITAGTVDVAAEFTASAPADHIADIKMEGMVAFSRLWWPDSALHAAHARDAGRLGKARYENGTLHFDIARGGAST